LIGIVLSMAAIAWASLKSASFFQTVYSF